MDGVLLVVLGGCLMKQVEATTTLQRVLVYRPLKSHFCAPAIWSAGASLIQPNELVSVRHRLKKKKHAVPRVAGRSHLPCVAVAAGSFSSLVLLAGSTIHVE
jgi:hypothetical protein